MTILLFKCRQPKCEQWCQPLRKKGSCRELLLLRCSLKQCSCGHGKEGGLKQAVPKLNEARQCGSKNSCITRMIMIWEPRVGHEEATKAEVKKGESQSGLG